MFPSYSLFFFSISFLFLLISSVIASFHFTFSLKSYFFLSNPKSHLSLLLLLYFHLIVFPPFSISSHSLLPSPILFSSLSCSSCFSYFFSFIFLSSFSFSLIDCSSISLSLHVVAFFFIVFFYFFLLIPFLILFWHLFFSHRLLPNPRRFRLHLQPFPFVCSSSLCLSFPRASGETRQRGEGRKDAEAGVVARLPRPHFCPQALDYSECRGPPCD